MRHKADDEIRQLHDDVAGRQYHQKPPQPIAEVLSRLLARRGYACVEASAERDNVWKEIVGEQMAGYSRLGKVRRGVLEVMVRNSAALQELTFQKKQLLRGIAAALPEQKIRDLRFRVGAVE